jgi:4'-phosphopantetheinyl transferase
MTADRKALTLGQHLDWQSLTLDRAPDLPSDEVHIWTMPLHILSEDQIEQAEGILSDQQWDRYTRRPTTALRTTYLAGRYFLLNLLAAYTSQKPYDIQLSYSSLNKPFLEPNPSDLSFNFTDTLLEDRSIGLFAFCRSRNVGVDIESLHRRSNFALIAERKFSVREKSLVTTDEGKIDEHKFLATWTRKEAYGKATGLGVNYKMSALEVASPGLHTHTFTGLGEHNTAHWLEQFYVGNDHIACATYSGKQKLTLKAYCLESLSAQEGN